MSDDNQDGGQAFPVPAGHHDSEGDWAPTEGMTLRDYFAGQAVTGCASHHVDATAAESLARAAYTLADALLKARAT